MLETDKALDILPIMGNIVEKLEIKDLGQEKDSKKVGMEIFKKLLTKIKVVKPELYEILRIIDDTKTEEEIKKQSLGKTMSMFKAVTEDKELMGFIKQSFK
jgi:hypothetical protein